MFHWICPECGREIAPAVKECPACDPARSPEPALEGVAAEAAGIFAEVSVETPALTPEVVFAPRVERSRAPAAAAVLTIEAEAEPAEVEPAAILAEPPAPPEPAVAAADPAIAPPTPLAHIAPRVPAPAQLQPEGPIPAEADPVTVGEIVVEPEDLSFPPAEHRLDDGFELAPAAPPEGRTGAAGPEPGVAPDAIRPQLVSQGPRPALAGLYVNSRAAFERIRPASSPANARGGHPQQITVPGPALPVELTSLEGAGISKILRPRAAKAAARASMPGWMLSAMVAATVVATAVSAALYLMPATAAPAPVPKAETKVEAKPVSPLAKFVEVTGFRHVSLGDKSEIRYLVVNHSAALMSDVTVLVTLRAAGAEPDAAPVSAFSFKLPKLGPWEAKEMVSPVEKVTRPGALPEWRDLAVDLEIGQ